MSRLVASDFRADFEEGGQILSTAGKSELLQYVPLGVNAFCRKERLLKKIQVTLIYLTETSAIGFTGINSPF